MRCELKQYERGADFSKTIQEGTLHLAGVDVFLNDGETIYECSEFTEKGLSEDYDIKGGTWYVEDGWVVGKNPNCCPGMLVSKKDYCGHVLLEVTVKMVSPSTHDINIMINGSWDEKTNRRKNIFRSFNEKIQNPYMLKNIKHVRVSCFYYNF